MGANPDFGAVDQPRPGRWWRRASTILAVIGAVRLAVWLFRRGRRPPPRLVVRRDVEPSPAFAEWAGRVDAADCWATSILPGDPRTAVDWAHAVLTDWPKAVVALLWLRDRAARLIRLKTSPPDSEQPYTGFPLLADATSDEAIMGVPDRHLTFRVSVRLDDGLVLVTTTVTIHNRLGRAYWLVVGRVHPVIVRRCLSRVPLPARSSPEV
ncbi:MAG: DUF2867 domain-containing protein [Propionibacteriaceae bacterium]|nr:DUF2867 domain-containing protein [Propionibacteriaceae bacterium]